MNHDEMALKIKAMLAELLEIDPSRLTVNLRPTGQDHLGDDTSQMTILIDGKDPEGLDREAILRWSQSLDGKLVGSA